MTAAGDANKQSVARIECNEIRGEPRSPFPDFAAAQSGLLAVEAVQYM